MKNVGKGLSRAHIIRSAEDSLRRLRCDWIDLYQAHFDDTAVSFEETLEAFASLIQSGKVRAIGASNYSAPRLTEALKIARAQGLPLYGCLQPHYNLVTVPFTKGICVSSVSRKIWVSFRFVGSKRDFLPANTAQWPIRSARRAAR